MSKKVKRQYVGQMLAAGEKPKNVDLILTPRHYEWITVLKTESTDKISTTTFSGNSLDFGVSAGDRAVAHVELFFDTGATPDFKFRITGPTSPTEVVIRGHYVEVGGTNDTDFVDTAFGTSHAVTGTGGTTGGYVRASLNLINGSNDGVVSVQWAQNTSDASNTTLLSGSNLRYIKF